MTKARPQGGQKGRQPGFGEGSGAPGSGMATSSHSNFNTRGLRSKLLLRSAKLSFAPPAAFVETIARDPRYGAILEFSAIIRRASPALAIRRAADG